MSSQFWVCPQCKGKIGLGYTECSICGYGKPERIYKKRNQEERENRNLDKSVRGFRLELLREMRYTVNRSRHPYRKQPSGFHIVK